MTFQELLKDIFLRKDELENDLQAAFELAKSKEELVKLSTTIMKLEKVLDELKRGLQERLTEPAVQLPPVARQNAVQTLVQTMNDMNKQALEGNTKRAPLLPTPATNAVVQQSVDNGQLPEYQRNYPIDWASFRKKPDLPDTQRVFLSHLDRNTTEEKLYYFFSNYGHVRDIKVFGSPGEGAHSGAVGFQSISTAERVLASRVELDGRPVVIRRYYAKEGMDGPKSFHKEGIPLMSEPKIPPIIYTKRFQVFCGGISKKCSEDDVYDVLSKFGEINEIRMSYIGDTYEHRGFAYIDFKKATDAVTLIKVRHVDIGGRKTECKSNTKPEKAILAESGDFDYLEEGENESVSDYKENYGNSQMKPKMPEKVETRPTVMSSPFMRPAQTQQAAPVLQSGKCIICKVNPRNCRLLWCAHTEVCMDCGSKLKNCPSEQCGEAIVERRKL